MDLPEPITRTEQYLYAIATGSGGGGGGGGDWQSVTLLTETGVTMSPGEGPPSTWAIEHAAELGIGKNDLIAVEVTGDLEVILTGGVGSNDQLEISASSQDGEYYIWADYASYYFQLSDTDISTAPIVNIRIAKIVPVGYDEDESDELQ